MPRAPGRCLLGALLWALSAAGEGPRAAQPEVATKYGRLQGRLAQVDGVGRAVSAFLGIPFAKPPVGSLRFSPPRPAEPWGHTRDATRSSPACLQSLAWMSALNRGREPKLLVPALSEDCLYLDVFTPDTAAKLPVMVWIHGGGFTMGGAWMYDGSALSSYENVVVVAVQYRLGLPGFFSSGTREAAGNWGLLDQVAALRWIQENIPAFGGDAQAITVFGESAGGCSVGALVLSPLARGLFQRAISESGVAQIPGLFTSHPEAFAEKVANLSGCEKHPPGMVQCLRSKTEGDLGILNANLTLAVGILPAVVDGTFLPKAPEVLLQAKEFSSVPYLVGMNNDEYGWLIPQAHNLSDAAGGMDRTTTTKTLQAMAAQLSIPSESVVLALEEYLGGREEPPAVGDAFRELMADMLFVVPTLQVARNHRDSGAPVYLYEFQHRPTAFKDIKPSYVKADHADELFFVFGGPFLQGSEGNGSFLNVESTEGEKELSRTIMKYWANFARHGDPNGEGLVKWPRYDLGEEYLELNLKQRKAKKLKEKRVDFWLKTLPEKMKDITEQKKNREEL